MKEVSINGFYRRDMEKYNLNMDDILLLNWLDRFTISDNTHKKHIDGEEYCWIKRGLFTKEFPIIAPEFRKYNRMVGKLSDLKLLKKVCEKSNKGTYTYIRLTQLFRSMFDRRTAIFFGSKSGDSGVSRGGQKSVHGADKKVSTKDSIYNNIGVSLNKFKDHKGFEKTHDIKSKSLLKNDLPGLDDRSLSLIKKLYKKFGIGVSRLPTTPEAQKISKTVISIIEIFNSLRAGTFLDDYEFDEDWISYNKIDLTPATQGFPSWEQFEMKVLLSVTRYLKTTHEAKRIRDVRGFFVGDRGVGGGKIPAYSLFLKFCMRKNIPESQAKISKIKHDLEKSSADTAEKNYNKMLAKFDQTFTSKEQHRFWNAVKRLEKWHTENREILNLQNRDGSFNTHCGGFNEFLSTLFNWLDVEGGAWGKLFPDIIQIPGEQWKQFCGYCRSKLGIELEINGTDTYTAMESAYKDACKLRKEYWASNWEDKLTELAWEISDETGKEYDDCEKEATERLKAKRFREDLDFEQKWSDRLANARSRFT